MTVSESNDNYLTGKLLLAAPGMGDSRFHRAVIFICAHDENGAMGLVINNRLAGMNFSKLLDQVGINSDIKIDLKDTKIPVMNGGPVEEARGFLLHSNDFKQDDTVLIDERFGITGTVEALKDVAQGNGPEDMLFILGYAGWSPGQLDEEIQQNSWLITDPDPSVIFAANPDEKWTKAVASLGIDPAMLSSVAGSA